MELKNLAWLHRVRAEQLGGRSALRYKRHGLYHEHGWDRYRAEALAAAAALIDGGVRPGDRVGLVGENSKEWLTADLAILTAGAVTVSPHAPLTARQIHYQLADAEVAWAFVSTAEQRDKLLAVRRELPALRGIVVFDPRAASEGVTPWPAFLQKGRSARGRLAGELAGREAGLDPESLAAVLYTSGTTGNPKGVMLTHGNLLSNAVACLSIQPQEPGDVVLSWLPYTHVYARTVDHYVALVAGSTLALAESAETLVDNLAEVKPTHLAGVPRFYEKVLSAVRGNDPEETGKRLRRVFGPRIDWLSSGGAPLPTAVAQAYQQAGILLLQGYGLTESSPVISFNTKADNKLGTVGRPIPGVKVRIAPDGEVLTHGPHVMRGYWKNPGATAEVIRDGWLHTGDLGTLDADGFLSITGRKKELLVLSTGKKVAPSNVEGLILADPCIDQVVVCGEGRPYLTALVVPHWDLLRAALEDAGRGASAEQEVERRIRLALAELSPAEQVRKFVLLPGPFTRENDEVTVSLKLRRGVILERHAGRIEGLYGEGEKIGRPVPEPAG